MNTENLFIWHLLHRYPIFTLQTFRLFVRVYGIKSKSHHYHWVSAAIGPVASWMQPPGGTSLEIEPISHFDRFLLFSLLEEHVCIYHKRIAFVFFSCILYLRNKICLHSPRLARCSSREYPFTRWKNPTWLPDLFGQWTAFLFQLPDNFDTWHPKILGHSTKFWSGYKKVLNFTIFPNFMGFECGAWSFFLIRQLRNFGTWNQFLNRQLIAWSEGVLQQNNGWRKMALKWLLDQNQQLLSTCLYCTRVEQNSIAPVSGYPISMVSDLWLESKVGR